MLVSHNNRQESICHCQRGYLHIYLNQHFRKMYTHNFFNRGRADYFNNYYVRPYCRMGPYIVGIIVGSLLYKTDCKVKINKVNLFVIISPLIKIISGGKRRSKKFNLIYFQTRTGRCMIGFMSNITEILLHTMSLILLTQCIF